MAVKTILGYLYYLFIRFALSLRYRIKVKGLEALKSKNLTHPGGILFLANHPAEIDPCILFSVLWPKFRPHPIAVEYLFRIPVVRYLLDFIGALPVPNFDLSSNSYKREQIERTYEKLFTFLAEKENLLLYPAGGLKNGAEEVLGGSSSVHYILQKKPELNIILIKTTGLWGSIFSRAPTGKTPNLLRTFLHGFKVLLKNGIFFAPRREVMVEFSSTPKDFPFHGERLEVNHYLERWYNSPAPEPLKLVSYSHFREDYPSIYERPKEEPIALENIPPEIRRGVILEVSKLAKKTPDEVMPEHHLSTDLGLDSLDTAQLIVALKEDYGVGEVQLTDLTTVASVMAFAARLKESQADQEEEGGAQGFWSKEERRPEAIYPEAETVIEAFFKTCHRFRGYTACSDRVTGEVPYNRLSISVILLAQAIQKLPGKHIGVMMPASVVVNAVILAAVLAGKVPVMINWTLGKRNLASVIEQSKIEATLTAWSFIDRLDNVELDGLDDQLIFLEDIRRSFNLWGKTRAFIRSKRSISGILRSFGAHRLQAKDPAVILFTSGTESVPKGVPLTHGNILSNQRAAAQLAKVTSDDIMLGVLPPFHSFGFSVTGLLPLLAGLRVAYSPNPTDGRRVARAVDQWKATLLCLAPTFLKNVLRVADSNQLSSLRLVVTGAEKTSSELYEKLHEMGPSIHLVEGYGITECSPILTLNPPDGSALRGVGVPLPGVELAIVHPESFEQLSCGEQGLILARGPNVFPGYLDKALPSPFVEAQGKLWYQTGDLGFLDEKGFLTLSGRFKRFIKIGGEMISLSAVEEALLQASNHLGWSMDPALPSLAISALEAEGKKSEMHLFVTFKTDVEEVNNVLRDSGMSNLIRIRSVTQLPFIPLLGSGKIDYKKLSTHMSAEKSE